MKLKALDTLHISSVGPDNLAPGAHFEVADDVGRSLIERGLAAEDAPQVAPDHKPAPKGKRK